MQGHSLENGWAERFSQRVPVLRKELKKKHGFNEQKATGCIQIPNEISKITIVVYI
jgi:hypothetical protein